MLSAQTPSQLLCAAGEAPPIVFVPSFDSSVVEYRRLLPALIKAGLPAYAVDVIGWGFTEAGFAADPSPILGPEQKREHLYAFWKEKVHSQPVCAQLYASMAATSQCARHALFTCGTAD